ncbi:MAG: NADP-dependent malic enzyme [Candidatus Marinimicrobia bacterium]|nr:NADP-dependent malic enzyme [Candidatus Neomarinimicrobiota bacterium]
MITKKDALDYHSMGARKGKIEVIATKPFVTQRDLSLAYSPGVAYPCLEIAENPALANEYTAKGNLVAVISNGTAVLGLGNIGALAGKPVMEGKGVLFKRFADIDVFDLELDTEDPDQFINAVKLLEPTFGGINLEDIKSPECFYIEKQLRAQMKIPVFHDDQHGTAIISAAALLNAVEVAGKQMNQVKIVVSGAGASALSCSEHYIRMGATRENLIMCDSLGVIYKGRAEGMNEYKLPFANDTKHRTLQEALDGADVFIGLSKKDVVVGEDLKCMAPNPIIFAMANPDPEITYPDAMAARPDAIMGTGRSDYPNQVNNVLGFPFIFRGALDVMATEINEEMKVAATLALAALAKEDTPDEVMEVYGLEHLKFGKDYLIPKPFDPRVLLWESVAVAEAAMKTGVAQKTIDLDQYRMELEARLGKGREFMRSLYNRAAAAPKRVIYPEGENPRIIRASYLILQEGIAYPILVGRKTKIKAIAKSLHIPLTGIEIVDPMKCERREQFVEEFYKLRQRKGVTLSGAKRFMERRYTFAAMMLKLGEADAMISGITQQFPDALRPVLQVIKPRAGMKNVAGLFLLIFKEGMKIFADVTVNIEPSAEVLADIALMAAEEARRWKMTPRVALLSFSNFGSSQHPNARKMRDAVKLIRDRDPNLMVDGEMNADLAIMPKIQKEHYPFSQLKGSANVLIFPDLQSSNISYKLVHRLSGAEAIGPILVGMEKPVHILQVGSTSVQDVANMTAIAVVDAQEQEKSSQLKKNRDS